MHGRRWIWLMSKSMNKFIEWLWNSSSRVVWIQSWQKIVLWIENIRKTGRWQDAWSMCRTSLTEGLKVDYPHNKQGLLICIIIFAGRVCHLMNVHDGSWRLQSYVWYWPGLSVMKLFWLRMCCFRIVGIRFENIKWVGLGLHLICPVNTCIDWVKLSDIPPSPDLFLDHIHRTMLASSICANVYQNFTIKVSNFQTFKLWLFDNLRSL